MRADKAAGLSVDSSIALELAGSEDGQTGVAVRGMSHTVKVQRW